jgi:hypothetical protein
MVRVEIKQLDSDRGIYFEDIEEELSNEQKAAYKRWANAYGYETWQGYFTAKYDIEWRDYAWLRENSP